MNKRTTFARNRQGVKVKRSCASCQHKCIGMDGSHLCALIMELVEPDYRCKKYKILEGLLNAGKGGGKIKTLKYLEFVRETRMVEQKAIDAGEMKAKDTQSNRALRRQFEELFGTSPFLSEDIH